MSPRILSFEHLAIHSSVSANHSPFPAYRVQHPQVRSLTVPEPSLYDNDQNSGLHHKRSPMAKTLSLSEVKTRLPEKTERGRESFLRSSWAVSMAAASIPCKTGAESCTGPIAQLSRTHLSPRLSSFDRQPFHFSASTNHLPFPMHGVHRPQVCSFDSTSVIPVP